MDKRKLNVSISKPGGTAGMNSLTYRLNIPNVVAKDMGITKENREVDFEYDETTKTIKIRKITIK